MGFSPQETARGMIQNLRSAHAQTDELASAVDSVSVAVIHQRIESICRSMDGAHAALQELQSAFDNATIAIRISNHLEPAPADIAAAYTAARTAWETMADQYGTTVLNVMGTPYVWLSVQRRHSPRSFDLDSVADFRANLVALRDALAVFA